MKKPEVVAAIALFFLLALFAGRAGALSLDIRNALLERGGLLWLSPTYTRGMSYNELHADLESDPGSDLFGLQVASTSDLDSLTAYYGIDGLFGPTDLYPDRFGRIYADFCPGAYGIGGWFGPALYGTETDTGWFQEMGFYQDLDGVKNIVHWDEWPMFLDYNHRPQGWWLVYPGPLPAPEPASWLLVTSGMVFLLVGSRSRRRSFRRD